MYIGTAPQTTMLKSLEHANVEKWSEAEKAKHFYESLFEKSTTENEKRKKKKEKTERL